MINRSIPRPWLKQDLTRLKGSKSFRCITSVALEVLRRFEEPVVMLSGPMTTGGKGNIDQNMEAYRKGVALLENSGLSVFNQLLAESEFRRLWLDWYNQGNRGYCWPILNDFYEPVFSSGMVRGLYFLPDWQSSTGCNRERELARQIPLEIHDMPIDWEKQIRITV